MTFFQTSRHRKYTQTLIQATAAYQSNIQHIPCDTTTLRFQSRSALAREFLLIKKGENFYSAPTTLNKQVTRAVVSVVVVVVVLDFMLTDRAGIIRGGEIAYNLETRLH